MTRDPPPRPPADRRVPPKAASGAARPRGADAQPHDGFFRFVFGRPENAAAALQTLLPAAVTAHLDLGALVRVDPVTGNDDLGERRSDLVFEARLRGRPVLIQFLFEHQSTVDEDMPLRLLRAMVARWSAWRRDHPGTRLPPIVPLVLAHGPRRWTGPRDLQGLLDLSGPPERVRALRPLLPQAHFVLDDLHRVPESALLSRPWPVLPKLATLLFKFGRPRADLSDALARWDDRVAAVATGADRGAWFALLRYLFTVTDTPPARLAERLAGRLPREIGEDIMTTADKLFTQGHQRGWQEGRLQGREEGREEGRRQTLRSQLRKHLHFRFRLPLSPDLEARIEAADAACLERWSDRVLDAPTLAAVFAD